MSSVASFLMRVCICFLVVGDFICLMDLTWSRAILIPLWLLGCLGNSHI